MPLILAPRSGLEQATGQPKKTILQNQLLVIGGLWIEALSTTNCWLYRCKLHGEKF